MDSGYPTKEVVKMASPFASVSLMETEVAPRQRNYRSIFFCAKRFAMEIRSILKIVSEGRVEDGISIPAISGSHAGNLASLPRGGAPRQMQSSGLPSYALSWRTWLKVIYSLPIT